MNCSYGIAALRYEEGEGAVQTIKKEKRKEEREEKRKKRKGRVIRPLCSGTKCVGTKSEKKKKKGIQRIFDQSLKIW